MQDHPDTHDVEQLQAQWGVSDAVRFQAGGGGLVCAELATADALARVYLHGAHVSAYQPRNHPDVLFVSERTQLEPGSPIRGGIPVCFPWFATHGDPPHGTARLQSWNVADTAVTADEAAIELTTVVDPFRLRYRVAVGEALTLTMGVENTSERQASFELALHTYFAVADVRYIEITGLEGREYLDKTQDHASITQDGPIRIEREVDRVYQHTPDTCTLHDPRHGRRVRIEKTNADSTVVWNPWTEKAARLPDLADNEWLRFVCIESGNVHDDAVTLSPGESHECRVRITSQNV